MTRLRHTEGQEVGFRNDNPHTRFTRKHLNVLLSHVGNVKLSGFPVACTHLPPVGVILVEDLQDFAAVEPKASLLAGDQIVVSGIVIEVAFHIRLIVQKHTFVISFFL